MNAVEIEEDVLALAERPFDAAAFPFAFLEAFGNKATTIKRLRAGASNRSDLAGSVRSSADESRMMDFDLAALCCHPDIG